MRAHTLARASCGVDEMRDRIFNTVAKLRGLRSGRGWFLAPAGARPTTGARLCTVPTGMHATRTRAQKEQVLKRLGRALEEFALSSL